MNSETRFEIGLKPVPASRPRVARNGMVFYPKAHSVYAESLKTILAGTPMMVTEEPVEVRFLFVMPRYKTSDHPVHRSDVDNLSKLPMDSMTKCERYWKDDDLIVALTSLKRFTHDGEEPHTKVRIIPLKGSVEDCVDQLFNR